MEKTEIQFLEDLEEFFKVGVHHSWYFVKNASVCIIKKYIENEGSGCEIEISEEDSERFKKYDNIRALDEVLEEIGIKTEEILLLKDNFKLKITFEK